MKKPQKIPEIDSEKMADLARSMMFGVSSTQTDNFIDLGFLRDANGRRAKLRLSILPAHANEQVDEFLKCLKGD
ncbi:hypothetical protein P886_3812 [Alteromonadaceae bacterium 2753L.S.0a.02]|nr:hypothetical protein P886_3812 [Alteromonadaceae bacterium 2753L.S.0a.02]